MSRQQRLTLVATILGSTIVFLDATVVNVALPAMKRDLSMGLAGQQWVVEAYLLALVSLLLVGGSMGDQFGRRRLFEIGLAGFGVTSLLCAVAPSEEFLIAFRALQGMAGALLVPGSLAIVAATFNGEARGKAVGTWTAWTGIATVVGPAGGGFLVETISWRAIFAVNIPLVVINLILTRRAVAESRDPDAFMGIDFGGISLSALGLGGPVFALIEQPAYGWGSAQVAIPLIVGLVLLAAFVPWERRSPQPMVPLQLFKVRNFTVGNLTTLTLYAGLGVATFFLVLFLQQVAGYTPLKSGAALLPITVVVFLLSKRFGALADRIGPHYFMAGGPVIAGLGLLLISFSGPGADYVSEVLPGVIVFGLGLAATVAPLTAAVLASVEQSHSGLASGVNNAIARVASLLAIAALGAVVAGSFQSRLDHDVAGRALDPSARAAVARARTRPLVIDTTGLRGADRTVVRAALVDASVSSFRLGMEIGAGLAVLGGLVALVGIENPRRRVLCADCPGGALAGASEDTARSMPAIPVAAQATTTA